MGLELLAKLILEGLVSHDKDRGLYSKNNGKPLTGDCQRTGTKSFVFKALSGCGVENIWAS